MRENAESIAFYGGEASEKRLLFERLAAAVTNYGQLLLASRNLQFFTSFYRWALRCGGDCRFGVGFRVLSTWFRVWGCRLGGGVWLHRCKAARLLQASRTPRAADGALPQRFRV